MRPRGPRPRTEEGAASSAAHIRTDARAPGFVTIAPPVGHSRALAAEPSHERPREPRPSPETSALPAIYSSQSCGRAAPIPVDQRGSPRQPDLRVWTTRRVQAYTRHSSRGAYSTCSISFQTTDSSQRSVTSRAPSRPIGSLATSLDSSPVRSNPCPNGNARRGRRSSRPT